MAPLLEKDQIFYLFHLQQNAPFHIFLTHQLYNFKLPRPTNVPYGGKQILQSGSRVRVSQAR